MAESEKKLCQNCQASFTIDASDFDFYNKIKVPPPTWCPECRTQRRFMFRNDRFLYKRQSDYSKKEIFSMFSLSSPVKIYEKDFWWSDKWNPMDYSRDYDWLKPFFEQFFDLLKNVPLPSMNVWNIFNSDYCTNAHDLKNCYLLFDSAYSEDSGYGNKVVRSNFCFDVSHINSCEFSYEGLMLNNCYKSVFSYNCEGCQNIFFSQNLVNCSNCVGCTNLRNKSYCIFNRQYSKEEYPSKLSELDFGSYSKLLKFLKEWEAFKIKSPVKYMQGRHNTEVSGDYIFESKHVVNSYMVSKAENCKYCQLIPVGPTKDCYDYTIYAENNELCYETLTSGRGYKALFSFDCFPNSREIQYCYNCRSSSNLFGCIGLRNKQYCILNKQYTKQEYEELVPKIIQHMNEMPYIDKKGRVYKYGEFFPPQLSPFSYNETIAQEYFPLTKEEALKQGYQWKDPEERNYKIQIPNDKLPDNIKDVKDDIIGKVIECAHQGKCNEQCTTAFKIIEPELQFYRKMNLPLPRLCPNCRHYQRLKQRNPLKLWHRKCQCGGEKSENGVYKNTIEHFHGSNPCPNEFETAYAPDRPEIVYCEKCYLAEVV
jgi:hypothetical protein